MEKFSVLSYLHLSLTITCLRTEDLRETFYPSLMFICTLAALKKSLKKNEAEIKKEMSRCYNTLVTVEIKQDKKNPNDEFLDFHLVFVG